MKPAYQFERLGMESNLPGILCRYSPCSSAGLALQASDVQSVGGAVFPTTISKHLASTGPVAKPGQSAPVMCDLFCGRGGWTKGFQAHGWRCIGIDLYPQPDYPGEFIQADIAQLYELPEADFYCCSSPCNGFTPHCMKMFRPNPPWPMTGVALFDHARGLLEATGKPYVMENVRCAEKFLGMADRKCGSFYLWGHVPAILPTPLYKAKWTKRPGRPGNFAPELLLNKRKRAAIFAEIPFALSSHIAQTAGVRMTPAFAQSLREWKQKIASTKQEKRP